MSEDIAPYGNERPKARHDDRWLKEKAGKLRQALADYSEQFYIRVSDDSRHAATCRRCKEILVGNREDYGAIFEKIHAHSCKEVDQ